MNVMKPGASPGARLLVLARRSVPEGGRCHGVCRVGPESNAGGRQSQV